MPRLHCREWLDAFCPLAQRNEPATCSDSGTASLRMFATAPGLALRDIGTRHAMATNERAQHATPRPR